MSIEFGSLFVWTTFYILNFIFFYRYKYDWINKHKPKRTLAILFVLIYFSLRLAKFESSIFWISVGWGIIIFGWLFSNHPIIIKLKPRPKFIRTFFFNRLNIPTIGHHIYTLGDYFQILGLSLIVGSYLLSILVILAYLIDSILKIKKVSSWKSLSTEILSLILKVALPILFVSTFISNTAGDFFIFWGTEAEAVNLLSLLIQIEFTIGALVFGLAILLIELTTGNYTLRLSSFLLKLKSLKSMVFISIISISFKLLLIANSTFFSSSPINTSSNFYLIDLAIWLFVTVAISYYFFTRDVFKLLKPEDLARKILSDFDEEWLKQVQNEWSKRSSRKKLNLNRDPMIKIERLLISSLEQYDQYSFQAILSILLDRVKEISENGDGVFLDEYFTNKFSSVVDVAIDKNMDSALEILYEYMEYIIRVKDEQMVQEYHLLGGAPKGSIFFFAFLESAIDKGLEESTEQAIRIIQKKWERLIKLLPEYSQLYLYNEQRMQSSDVDITDDEKNKLKHNDAILDAFRYGFGRNLGDLAKRAIRKRQISITTTIIFGLSYMVNSILNSELDDKIKSFTIQSNLVQLQWIIEILVEEKVRDISHMPILWHNRNLVIDKDICNMLANFCCYYLRELSKSGLLSRGIVEDIARAARFLSNSNPKAAITIFEIYPLLADEVNTYLKNEPNSNFLYNTKYSISETTKQLENYLQLKKGIKTKTKRIAANTRKKLGGTKPE